MTRIDQTRRFGVYILTYPGDSHLSVILVRSIQQVSPGVPIMIIPGEGFDRDDHPFDVPIMPTPTGAFWPELAHTDRKFWAFQGPFETFLYLDADTICTRSLAPLVRRIDQERGDFIYVQPWIDDRKWRAVMQDPAHPEHAGYVRHVGSAIGRGPLAAFDPDHDFFARYPFNSGVFVSRRLAIKEADLAALNRAERAFCRDVLGLEAWSWRSHALFFRDQGRLNYLAAKLGIPVLPLGRDLICRAGASATEILVADVESGACDFHIVHWMGAKSPSPSLFCRGPLFRLHAALWAFVGRRTGRWVAPGYERLPECVGYSLWRHHYEQTFGPMSLRARLAWSWTDLKKACRLLRRCLKLLARSASRSLSVRLRSPGAPRPAAGLSRPSRADSLALRQSGDRASPGRQSKNGPARPAVAKKWRIP
jgi:hypothetical protein